MRTRELGRTGLPVSELTYGAAFVTKNEQGFQGARELIDEALSAGINLIDTSADYGDSETAVGRALAGEERPVIVCTKLGPRSADFDPKDKGFLRREVEKSLELLNRDYIDILMIHEPDRPGQIDWWEDMKNFKGPVSELLKELKDEKIIGFTGLGGTTAYEIVPIIETGFYDVLLTAFNYSILWREAELEVFPAAKKQDMGIMLGSPTQQGWLAHRYDEQIKSGNSRLLNKPRREQLLALYEVADDADIPIPELALRWALMNCDASTVLTGARKLSQLRQNINATQEGPLDKDIVARLDEVAAMVPFRPFEEPFFCPFYHDDFDTRKRPGPAG